MQPATTKPTPCEICGAPVLPDLLTGEALDAKPTTTRHGETLWTWHRCNVDAPSVVGGPKRRHGSLWTVADPFVRSMLDDEQPEADL